MGMRKGINITYTDCSEPVEDRGKHTIEDHGTYETQSHHTGSVTEKNKNIQTLITENAYEKSRQLRIEQNVKKLKDLGVRNIVNSMKSSSQRPQYIPPLSLNRVIKLTKQHRVVASNVSKKSSPSSNAKKLNKGGQMKMVLIDEVDDGDDERFQECYEMDMEVGDEDQDDEFEDLSDQCDTQLTNHECSKDQDNVQEQLQSPVKEMETCSNSRGNSKERRKRLHIISNETQGNVEDHHTVEDRCAVETQGPTKKVRGYTKKAETWTMDSTQRILVTFNKFGKPVGDEGNELVQFLGTLVRMSEHVSIEYDDWRKVPKENKEDMYSLVKSKFIIHPAETNEIKKWILHDMGKKWRAWKGSLKERTYDPSLSVNEIVAQLNDKRVDPTQFKKLVTSWVTPKFQNKCELKRLSRAKMKEPHAGGTKSFARRAHEMAEKNNGVYPTRGELYIATHTRRDGQIVNDNAAHVVASLNNIANDSTITPGNEDRYDFSKDDYSKVKGPEKSGYIRLVGRMPSAKSSGASSKDLQSIDKLTSVVNAMAMIIQQHIPNANLSSVLSNMNAQVPGNSLFHSNSLPVDETTSPRGHNDDEQERSLDN